MFACLAVVASGDATRGSARAATPAWLVYTTSAELPKDYGCVDVPARLDRLRTWPGGVLPSPRSTADDPVWSPDGTRIAFASGDTTCTNGDGLGQEAARIWVVDATGSHLHAVTKEAGAAAADPVLDLSPSWSPDGRRIAFAGFDIVRGGGGIYVVGADGKGLVRLSRRTALSLDWSPDGRSIAFVPGERLVFAYRAANRVALLDIRSRRVRTYRVDDPYDVSWSPDGRAIAVTGRRTISILDTTGRLERRIAVAGPPGLRLNGVTWAPDGRRIAYGYGRAISTVDLDGHGTKRIVSGTAPDWRP